MVVFICNHCGESLKKQVVANHSWRCKRDISVSCMDCLKDFIGQAYDAHTVCISEAEKYSAKGFVPKANKGVQKQESWLSKIRSIPAQNNNLSPDMKNIFAIITRNDNIPRKKAAFMNFFQNSVRGINKMSLETVWTLIEKEVSNDKQTPEQTNDEKKEESSVPAKNGTTDQVKNGDAKKVMEKEDTSVKQKMKMKQTSENDEAPPPKKQKKSKNVQEDSAEKEETQSTKQKKRKSKDSTENGHTEEEPHLSKNTNSKSKDHSQNGKENGANGADTKAEEQEQNDNQEKFSLREVIRECLISHNNQMKLSKLKKKVQKRYQQVTGVEVDGKFEKKFQKKIAKGEFEVENDTVRLIEA